MRSSTSDYFRYVGHFRSDRGFTVSDKIHRVLLAFRQKSRVRAPSSPPYIPKYLRDIPPPSDNQIATNQCLTDALLRGFMEVPFLFGVNQRPDGIMKWGEGVLRNIGPSCPGAFAYDDLAGVCPGDSNA